MRGGADEDVSETHRGIRKVTRVFRYTLGDFMEQIIEAIGENFSTILSGFFVIIGTFLGWFLNLLTTEHQNKVQLAFVAEGTPSDELTDPELRTKTSPSEWSIRIINTGRTACFLESFEIIRKGHVLVDCYAVCDNHDAIMPSGSILYILMQQDADTLQYSYSKHYKSPNKLYLRATHLCRRIPLIRNYIVDPLFKQGECVVIAYTVNGKRIRGKIDLPLLYIRHTASDSIVGV